MTDWDVGDVVEFLKTFGLSRDVLIFVFRHNIDGATMDESVELLVKDFQLDDEDLEYQIIDKWKEVSRKGLLPAQVLRPEIAKASTPSAASQEGDLGGNKIEPPSPAVFTHLRTAAWSRSGKISVPVDQTPVDGTSNTSSSLVEDNTEQSDGEQDPPPVAVFKHLQTSAWSRSVKVMKSDVEPAALQSDIYSPNVTEVTPSKNDLQPELELVSDIPAQSIQPNETDKVTIAAEVSRVATPSPSTFSFVDQVMAGFDDFPSVTPPTAEPVIVPAQKPVEISLVAAKETETVSETVATAAELAEKPEELPAPTVEGTLTVKRVEEADKNLLVLRDLEPPEPVLQSVTTHVDVEVRVPFADAVEEPEESTPEKNKACNSFFCCLHRHNDIVQSVVEGDSYATEDWEAELEDLHRHSIAETPARTITPQGPHPTEVGDTVGFETEAGSVAEEESIPDLSPRMEHMSCDVFDLEDPELDAVIAKQTEEYNIRVSQKLFTSPTRTAAQPATTAAAPVISIAQPIKRNQEAEIIAKYEQEMKKQAELLRVQQEQIQLQKQLIEQQRRDLSEAAQRKAHTTSTKHTSNAGNHRKGNKPSFSPVVSNKSINDSFVPVRAALNYDLSGRTESPNRAAFSHNHSGSNRFSDNMDPFYPHQALVSMPHDSISMLSDSGIFDMYQSNFPFPGVFQPESSITSQNSGEYDAYRKQSDISPPPEVLKQQISKLTSDGGYDEPAPEPQPRPYVPSYQNDDAQYRDSRGQTYTQPPEQKQQNNNVPRKVVPESRHVSASRHMDRDVRNSDPEPDRDRHDRPLPDHFPRPSPRPQHGAYDHTQLTDASTDSAGHVWHHTQTRRAPRGHIPASRAPIPVLNLNTHTASEPTTSSQTLSILVPETSSPVSPRNPDAAFGDLVEILKQLASTNIALTQALRPVFAPQPMGSTEPFTSRSAPVTYQPDAHHQGCRNTFLTGTTTGIVTDTGTSNANLVHRPLENQKPERPVWDDHTYDAAQALLTARSAPQGRPHSRASTSSTGATAARNNSRGGPRPRTKSDHRATAAPKPALQDYIDLLAQQFAARPLCQTPYFAQFTTNPEGENNKSDVPIYSSHQQGNGRQDHNIFAALDQERSFLHPYQYSQTASSTPQHIPQFSDLPRMLPFSAPASPTRQPKGGIILLKKSPTEIVFEGPNYAAPIERKEKKPNGTELSPRVTTSPGKNRSVSPRYAAPIKRKVKDYDPVAPPSPSKNGVSFGPSRVAARPNTAGAVNNTPFPSALANNNIAVDPSSKGMVAAAPPNTARPSTTGSTSGRNKARVLVPASAQS